MNELKAFQQAALKQQYMQARKSFLSSLSRRRRAGFDVSHIKVPSIPKNITEGSIRQLNKAIENYKYDVKHSASEGSIQRQRAKRYDEKKEEILAKRRATIAARTYYHQDLGGLPSFESKAVDDLMEIIDNAIENTGNTIKQDAYFALVDRRAKIAKNFFENMGINDPELKKVYAYNLEKTYERAAALLERYIWYDSDGGYNTPDVNSLNVIKQLMTLFTKEEIEERKRVMDVEGMSMQADEAHEENEKYRKSVAEAKKEAEDAYKAFVKMMNSISADEAF